MLNKGCYCRGRWISLEEDGDGCWLQTPYSIQFGVPHRCSTMRDVNMAKDAGMLFPDEESAWIFIQESSKESSQLNEKAEGADKQMEDEDSVYCPICGHCGEIGCCGIKNFIDFHLMGKTGCPYGDSILTEIKEDFDEYIRTISENYNDITVYMVGELKKDSETKKYKIERIQGRRGGHVYTNYKHAENAYKEWMEYHPDDHFVKIWALSGSLLELKSPEVPEKEKEHIPQVFTLTGKITLND